MEQQSEQHVLTIENCKRITAAAIDSVDSFSATQLVLSSGGKKIVVGGSEMKITGFSKSSGAFSATGNITSVKYSRGGVGLRQRLFK